MLPRLFEVCAMSLRHYDIIFFPLKIEKNVNVFLHSFFSETICTRFCLTRTHIRNISLQSYCDVNI